MTSVSASCYCLVLLTLLASFWFPSTALPFGGPNIWLGLASILVVSLSVCISRTTRAHFAGKPINLLLMVLLLAPIWICTRLIQTNTFSQQIIGGSFIGFGIFVATYFSLSSLLRIRWMLTTIVGTVFLSVLFGFLVIHGDDFFWRIWLNIASPAERFSEDVQFGRLAGLAPRVVNLSYHLTVAIPVSVALLVYNLSSNRIRKNVYDGIGYVVATILIASVFVNGTRSLLLGAMGATILVLLSPTLMAATERVNFIRRAGIVTAGLTAGVFVTITAYSRATWEDTELSFESAFSPPPNCLISLGKILGKKSVSDAWTEDCLSFQRPGSLAYYYEFILESPSLMTADLISERSNPYLYLYSKERGYETLVEDDNGSYLRNSRIVDGRLDPGIYVLEATTYDPEPQDSFTLALTVDCCDEDVITLHSEKRETLTSAWGQICPLSDHRKGAFARRFRLHNINSKEPLEIQVEAEGLSPSLFLFSETATSQVLSPINSTKGLIGDRWHFLKHTYSHLSSGGYVVEAVADVPGVEGNFIIKGGQLSSGEVRSTDSIEASVLVRSQAKPPDRLETDAPDLYRVVDFSNDSWFRLHMMVTAIRYGLEFPLGTGNKYAPQLRHINKSWGRENFIKVIASIPHNQFLYCLVQYGFPGLALLTVLYLLTFQSITRSVLLCHRFQVHEGFFMTIAVSGAMIAYLINSLFHDHGPFTKDWAHLILIGTVLATERVLRSSLLGRNEGQGTREVARPIKS